MKNNTKGFIIAIATISMLSLAACGSTDDISSVAVNVLDGGEFTGETSGEVMVG